MKSTDIKLPGKYRFSGDFWWVNYANDTFGSHSLLNEVLVVRQDAHGEVTHAVLQPDGTEHVLMSSDEYEVYVTAPHFERIADIAEYAYA